MLNNLRRYSHTVLLMPRSAKIGVVLSVDASLCILSVWLAYYLRLGELVTLSDAAIIVVAASIFLALPVFLFLAFTERFFAIVAGLRCYLWQGL